MVDEGNRASSRVRGEMGETPFLPDQVARYQRQMILPELGPRGQRRLMEQSVLVVGAGALGSAAAFYLAAAGVGTIGIVDGDRVDLSNLHRQILHNTADVGRMKTASARERLSALNPDIRVVEHPHFLDRDNVMGVLAAYDLVVDGSDTFGARYLVNDACVMLKKPLVSAAILRFEGQLYTFVPGSGCYRCIFPEPPPPDSVPSCAEAGVLGAVAGVLGTAEAVEALKILAGVGRPTVGRLGLYDALEGRWQYVGWRRDSRCAVCGDAPTITELPDYREWCGSPVPAALGSAPEIGAEEAFRLLQTGGAELWDVRHADEFRRGHAPGARLGDAEAVALGSSADTTAVLVCLSGVRSRRAADALVARGLPAVSVRGGALAWIAAGLPWDGAGPV
jgi:molybdopterin/thiamine biosynthesis adenylyltransferase/rhodanese-related sulfurtransferase